MLWTVWSILDGLLATVRDDRNDVPSMHVPMVLRIAQAFGSALLEFNKAIMPVSARQWPHLLQVGEELVAHTTQLAGACAVSDLNAMQIPESPENMASLVKDDRWLRWLYLHDPSCTLLSKFLKFDQRVRPAKDAENA
eukprot:s1052_g7.t1